MRLLPFVALFVLGCGPARHVCPTGFVGDPKLAAEAVVIWTDGINDTFADLTDGQALPLEPPPQGGYVIYVAARVRNMDGCALQFRGRLRDADTHDEVGYDARSSNLVVRADGYGYPEANNSDVSNVNGCPQVSPKDVQGKTYDLEMTVVDQDGRTVVVVKPVVPTCSLADPIIQNHCVCTCSANYFPGKCGFGDGGA